MAVQKKTSWLKWLVALIILGGGTAVGVKYYYHAGGEKPDYRTAVVARGDVTQAVTATGQLNPVVNVQVGSQVSGIISKLYVDYNSPVKEGQVIAQLDPATFKAASDQAAGDLASSKAALELASVEAKRAAELRKNDLIAQSDFQGFVLHRIDAHERPSRFHFPQPAGKVSCSDRIIRAKILVMAMSHQIVLFCILLDHAMHIKFGA